LAFFSRNARSLSERKIPQGGPSPAGRKFLDVKASQWSFDSLFWAQFQ